jgi:3-oxoacyl-[acyl-carrier-protein] synthase-3
MGIKISDINYHLPVFNLTNKMISDYHPHWDVDKTSIKTGVNNRHISDQNETAFDLSVNAVSKLFTKSKIKMDEIGAIIYCTQSPDYIMPSNSHLIHKHFNFINSVWCFDYNLACSGFVYGIAIARGFIETKMAKHILLITSDTYSRYINDKDRSTRLLFGDGAAASIISYTSGKGIIDIILSTDGSSYKSFYIPAGGARMPLSSFTRIESQDIIGNVKSKENIHMEGKKVFDFISKTVPDQILDLLRRNNLKLKDIDQFIFHQASKLTLDSLANTLGIDENKYFTNLKDIGNTVSSSIPIALKQAIDLNRIQKGDLIIISGFGVGLSWGSILYKVNLS